MMMTRRSKRRSYSKSRNKGAKYEHIPFDLVTKILLRLPEKSVSRFRCVSKLWDSTIRSPNFNESFFTMSSSHPKLLFACKSDDRTFFFSSPQPQNSSSLTARLHTSFPIECDLSDNICGQWTFGPTEGTVQTVCNLSTGQILTLPEVKNAAHVVKSSLGFDPTDTQIKVFCTAGPYEHLGPGDLMHQVLTLGTGKEMSWRKMTCDVPRFGGELRKVGICINGVLYYLPLVSGFGTGYYDYDMNEPFKSQVHDIFFFDLRYEKFGYIKKAQDMKVVNFLCRPINNESALANYKGKLAKLELWDHGLDTSIKMWVLQDAEKHQWSSYSYDVPPPWKYISGTHLHFVGITNNGEIVMSPEVLDKSFYFNTTYFDSFYLVYYNTERNTITRVAIKGMEAYWKSKAYVFLDYVENVKLMPQRSCLNSRNEGAKYEHITLDLATEILLRLPAKSISRFRCVSKLWDSTIRSPNFAESFFTVSSSHPKLLFACISYSHDRTFFFSSPQPQNSSSLTARLHTSIHTTFQSQCDLSDNICGQWTFGPQEVTDRGTVQTICNLSTGQVLALPEMKEAMYMVKSSLGFDPTEQKIKVFCTAEPNEDLGPEDLMHQVLTLGTGKEMSWRKITCDIPRFKNAYRKVGICINGVFYYLPLVVYNFHDDARADEIVFLDLRYEKFGYIKFAPYMKGVYFSVESGNPDSALANYKGKLAKLELTNHGLDTSIKMWVLQDAEKHQWSSYTYVLPPPWKSISGPNLHFVGISNKGEIVMSPEYIEETFYLIYYNPERNTITRVGIKGMEAYRESKAYVFLDYVENVKLLPNI